MTMQILNEERKKKQRDLQHHWTFPLSHMNTEELWKLDNVYFKKNGSSINMAVIFASCVNIL